MKAPDVIIVGGGFAGLTAAAALSRQGASVTVFERAPSYDRQFRGELIHPRGVRGLDAVGLAQPLFDGGGIPVRGFAVTPGAGADATLLPYRSDSGPGMGIDHEHMVLTMRREVARRAGVQVVTGLRVSELLREGQRVTGVEVEGGAVHRASLVVLADGRQSKLRARLGLEPEVTLLSHTIAFGVEGTPLPWGLRGHVFLGGPGPILAYPYGEGRVRFCVDVPLGAAKGKAAIIEYLVAKAAPVVPQPLRDAMEASLRTHGFEGCANQSIQTQACAAPGVV
ncbi:MAG: FAD-dependent oxidoreductase, partial [Archangium sp.]|nr:FAD-dependent oxidoreductase [Archangium sp.]